MAGRPHLPDAVDRVRAATDEIAHLPPPTLPGSALAMPAQEQGLRGRTPARSRP
jgi:hypothetical protein